MIVLRAVKIVEFYTHIEVVKCTDVAVLFVPTQKSRRWVCGQLWARFDWKHSCG